MLFSINNNSISHRYSLKGYSESSLLCINLCKSNSGRLTHIAFKKALYCNEHKLEGMVNVISKRCIHEENGIRCKTIPTYLYV